MVVIWISDQSGSWLNSSLLMLGPMSADRHHPNGSTFLHTHKKNPHSLNEARPALLCTSYTDALTIERRIYMFVYAHMELCLFSTRTLLSFDCTGDERLGSWIRTNHTGGKNRGKRNWLWSIEKFNSNLKCWQWMRARTVVCVGRGHPKISPSPSDRDCSMHFTKCHCV